MRELAGFCLVTSDVDRLRAFYEVVLGVAAEGGGDFAQFTGPQTYLVLYSKRGMEELAPGCMKGAGSGNSVLEFAVDDVDDEYARMQALGAAVVKPPTTQPWGVRSAWFRDPDGNILNFRAPVAPKEGDRA